MKAQPFTPFFIFHLGVGTRLALKKLAPILTAAFVVYYLLRPELFNIVFASLLERRSFLLGLVSTVLSLSIAGMAAPRVCLGLNGWIRHLPARSLTRRRLAGLAIAVSQIPLLGVLAALAIIALKVYKVSPVLYLLGLPVLSLSAGLCVLPVQRNVLSKPLSFASCVLSTSGHWIFLVAAIVLLIIADLTAGSLSPPRKRRIRQKSIPSRKVLSGLIINGIFAFRALRLRLLLAFLPALFILGMTLLFLSNNTLSSKQMIKGVIFGGNLSIAVFIALATHLLAVRRPPWPWARSLPWSAHHRILTDAIFMGLLALPLVICVAIIKIQSLWPVVASLPLLAAFAALIVREAFLYPMGAVGRTFMAGTVVSVLVCLIPVLSLLFLGLTPFILIFAARADKHQKVSRWLEIHNLAAGDSLSWSRQ